MRIALLCRSVRRGYRTVFSGGEVSFRSAEFSGGEIDFGGARFSGGEVDRYT